MSFVRAALVLLAAAASTGCLRVNYTMNLKPDGSGTIHQTIAMTPMALQQLGPILGAKPGASPLPTEAQLRQQASAMGQGVQFVRSTPYSAEGMSGITGVFSFSDVSKLNLNVERSLTSGVRQGAGDAGADVRLALTKAADRSTLVIQMPEIPQPDESVKKQAEQAAQQAPQMEAMFKTMLAGLRAEVIINFEGRILKTNAPYVEGSRVVLVRLDAEQFLKTPGAIQQVLAMAQKGFDEKSLRRIPGIKIVTQPQVRVEFR